MELNARALIEFDEKLEGATDIWFIFWGAALANEALSKSESLNPEFFEYN